MQPTSGVRCTIETLSSTFQVPPEINGLYVMANVTTFTLGLSQKPDVTISAFPLMSSRSQSVCISDVLRVIDVVDGRGSVSLAG